MHGDISAASLLVYSYIFNYFKRIKELDLSTNIFNYIIVLKTNKKKC